MIQIVVLYSLYNRVISYWLCNH